MITANISETKAHLSELLKKVQNGETVIITAGRAKKPVARIELLPHRLGLATAGFKIPDSFFDPLPEEELRLWEGEDELPTLGIFGIRRIW